jgi:hypothetical protein
MVLIPYRHKVFGVLLLFSFAFSISYPAQSRDDDAVYFLPAFKDKFLKPRMEKGYGGVSPETFWKVEQTIIEGSRGIINIRSGLGFTSAAVDRFVGFVLAAPNSISSFKDALGVIAVVSEAHGLLEDLGLLGAAGAEQWLYDISSNLGWIYAAKDVKDSYDVVRNISSFHDIYALADGGLKASDARKLMNLEMAGFAVADFILDKTLVAQVRTTLRMDRMKMLLLALRLDMARELEILFRKAASGSLTWREAYSFMQLEGQYFARKMECYRLDELYWQEQLSPTVGRLPFTKKTLMDLMPGYDNPELERENLELAKSRFNEAQAELAFSLENCQQALEKWENEMALAEEIARIPPLSFRPSQREDMNRIIKAPFVSDYGDIFVGEKYLHEFFQEAFDDPRSKLYPLYNWDMTYDLLGSNPDFRRYPNTVAFRLFVPQWYLESRSREPGFGHDEEMGYVYCHIRDKPDSDVVKLRPFYMGRREAEIAVLEVNYLNIDEDREPEFFAIFYLDNEELPVNLRALDRHSLVFMDVHDIDMSSNKAKYKKYKIPFYATRYLGLQVGDANSNGQPDVLINYEYNGQNISEAFELTAAGPQKIR